MVILLATIIAVQIKLGSHFQVHAQPQADSSSLRPGQAPSKASQSSAGSGLPANNGANRDLQGFDFQFPAMGTLVQITAYCEDEDRLQVAIQATQQTVVRLASVLTDYDPASETRQLSEKAAHKEITVSQPLWDVLEAADLWYYRSDGKFDCSLGALTSTWRKYRRAGKLPDNDTIALAKQHCGWDKIRLNHAQKTVLVLDEKLRLDFGAIGKGFIADQAFQVLQQHNIPCCMINISGNMRCGQAPPGRQGWLVAINSIDAAQTASGQPPKPAPDTNAIMKIYIANQAIATSGDLWQYTMIDGVKRSHILDPISGYGVPGPLAVTVVAPTAMDADALATMGCLMDWDKFGKLLEGREGRWALHASRPNTEMEVRTAGLSPPQHP